MDRHLIPFLLLGLTACRDAASPVETSGVRPVCGWDRRDGQTPELNLSDETIAPAGFRVVVRAPDETPFSSIRKALVAAGPELLRVKVLYGERALLPLTVLKPLLPPLRPAPADDLETAIVGHHKVKRAPRAPRDRFAGMRLTPGAVELHVENDPPKGRRFPAGELGNVLRTTHPPVGTFALTVDDQVQWGEVREAVKVAGCFDRQPGDEPHEIILDLEQDASKRDAPNP